MNPFVEINWHEGWANTPDLILHEYAVPLSHFVFTHRDGLYYACDKDSEQVSYFSYKGPGSGYGGHKFTINMDDGTQKELSGPWSSRAGVMNGAGFPHCVECTFVDSSGGKRSGNILITRAKELLANSGLSAVYEQRVQDGEYSYEIIRKESGSFFEEEEEPDIYCYQCHLQVNWLAPDSRCRECTRYTPEEITSELYEDHHDRS